MALWYLLLFLHRAVAYHLWLQFVIQGTTIRAFRPFGVASPRSNCVSIRRLVAMEWLEFPLLLDHCLCCRMHAAILSYFSARCAPGRLLHRRLAHHRPLHLPRLLRNHISLSWVRFLSTFSLHCGIFPRSDLFMRRPHIGRLVCARWASVSTSTFMLAQLRFVRVFLFFVVQLGVAGYCEQTT